MPLYVRVLACLGSMVIGGFLGFWPAEVLAEALLPTSQGPSPYGDWRPMGYGLFAGAPLGATAGLAFAWWVTAPRKGDTPKTSPWGRWLAVGLVVGLGIGVVLSGTPLAELFQDVGKLLGSALLGIATYFVICATIGAAMFSVGALLWARLR